MIDKTDGLQVFIDSLGHAGGLAIAVVYEGFDSCILVWINAGIAVDGYEIIGPASLPFSALRAGLSYMSEVLV